jgi:hypothetical protein
MFQPKARRFFPVLTLIAVLFFAPLASVRAQETAQASTEPGLLEQVTLEIVSIWDALATLVGDAGPRMDDNG